MNDEDENVTITLEEKVARWARIRAAKDNTSLSRMMGDMLYQRMIEEQGYNTAMKQFLSSAPVRLKKSGTYPKRDQLHKR